MDKPSTERRIDRSAHSPLRQAITDACCRPEVECLPELLELANAPPEAAARVAAQARALVQRIRAKPRSAVDEIMLEYSLSSAEGIALMRLAEAYLRIPDVATRDALIRDKIGEHDWRSHLGRHQPLAVNAATLGAQVASRILSNEDGQGPARRTLARAAMPFIRGAVTLAMRRLGRHFVAGETIETALRNSSRQQRRGYRHSYDMLGEAAMTAADAARYLEAYETAIHAVGRHADRRGAFDGPGISVKLSALHPRYARSKIERVHDELLPRLKHLASLAKQYDIGFNIDAEEADRLELSLDLIEALCLDPDLGEWDGIGFAVQAYQKRAPHVIDWAIDLGRRSQRRLMIRLVKGAYWDTEIKRGQVEGLADFPVFTRKVHTDVCFLACARKLLAAPDAVFPQFATHNAQTIAAVMEMAGGKFHSRQYEFQCLHGMGERIYDDIVGPEPHNRPCRIYAPVGSFDTLLAYLVRRLIENGANSSFVNRIGDETTAVEELIAHPVEAARSVHPVGAPHERISLPADIHGAARVNSQGLDLSSENDLSTIEAGLRESADVRWTAAPKHAATAGPELPVRNPADLGDIVGHVRHATREDIHAALSTAAGAARHWAATPAVERAACLARAAELLQARMPLLVGLIVREAGKTRENAIGEVREAVDFLRYYGHEAVRTLDDDPQGTLGPVVCISPWNFPLAIFTGQVAAALAAGNAVLAKPAEETPLIAAEAVRILHESGIPAGILQLLPGDGEVGAALVADQRAQGVLFTGSTAVARLIQKQLAKRLSPDGQPIPLIAETGGQNALIVDSSALPEQAVADIMKSAFDSAGQRCSALRILCLQEEIAPAILPMLRGAMDELATGDPRDLATDVGPIITADARKAIQKHIDTMRARGYTVFSAPLRDTAQQGNFIAPTLIEIEHVSDVEREIFGPVLHVLRYRRDALSRLLSQINDTGYGLTFGVHSRIDRTATDAAAGIAAGNIYLNRNMIGAVVGVQPFGGSGLSGTGPKAGGPLYLGRLRRRAPQRVLDGCQSKGRVSPDAHAYVSWLRAAGYATEAAECEAYNERALPGCSIELAGPVGEQNFYELKPRGRVAALAHTERDLLIQLGAILATGNVPVLEEANPAREALAALPPDVARRLVVAKDWRTVRDLKAVLFAGEPGALLELLQNASARDGPILLVQAASAAPTGATRFDLHRLMEEKSTCVNSAAAGGNASLMSM